MNEKNWPPIEGRYKVGNKNSPIAVCTLASIDEIEVNLKKIAIIGKCVTENLGIEKMIQNIVSNSNIRYLIFCGRESKGHFVFQAVESLVKNGINEEKRIMGAMGSMPYLRNIEAELVQRFREQIEIMNMVGETNGQRIEETIDKILEGKTEKFKAKPLEIKKIVDIEAKPTAWIPDPNGYFLIFLDRGKKKIIVEHYQEGKINQRIVGKNAKEIGDTIAKLDLIGKFKQTLEHSMYLARELQRAEFALRENLDFEQDEELKTDKINKEKTKPTDEYSWHD